MAALYLANSPEARQQEIHAFIVSLLEGVRTTHSEAQVVRLVDAVLLFGSRAVEPCRDLLAREDLLAIQLFVVLRSMARLGVGADQPEVFMLARHVGFARRQERLLEDELRQLELENSENQAGYRKALALHLGKQAGMAAVRFGLGYLGAQNHRGVVPGASRGEQARNIADHAPRVGTAVDPSSEVGIEQERRRRVSEMRNTLQEIRSSNEKWAPRVHSAARDLCRRRAT